MWESMNQTLKSKSEWWDANLVIFNTEKWSVFVTIRNISLDISAHLEFFLSDLSTNLNFDEYAEFITKITVCLA